MSLKIKIAIFILLTSCSINIQAQKNVTNQSLAWYGYFLTLQFNDKWYCQTEVQERHFFTHLTQHQFLFRSHIHRVLTNNNWEISAGMCVMLHNPNNLEAIIKLTIPELRPHLEIANKNILEHLTLDHRFRVELRYFQNTNPTKTALEDGFEFSSFRFRYKLQATIPIFKIGEKRTLKIKVSNDIVLSPINNITEHFFDQNQLFAGISFDLIPNLIFDLGYLNQLLQRPMDDYYDRHILRFTVFQKINL